MTTFDYASLGDLSKIYPHLNEHSTLPQIMFALDFFNQLTVSELQNRDVLSYSKAPLYLATGFLAAANTSKAFNRKYEDFYDQLQKLGDMPNNSSVSEKSHYILWLNNIYMDSSEKTLTERDFLFKLYPDKVKYVQYQDPVSSNGFRLELVKIDDILYKNMIMWNASVDDYSVIKFNTHQFDIIDYDDLYSELYRDVPSYYFRDNSITYLLNLLSSVDLDTTRMGQIWFGNWLNTTLSMSHATFTLNTNGPMLKVICNLLQLDSSAVKERVEVLCNLGLIDVHNMHTYIESIYEAGRNSLTFKNQDLQIVDFNLVDYRDGSCV